jgi:hypothetical protein
MPAGVERLAGNSCYLSSPSRGKPNTVDDSELQQEVLRFTTRTRSQWGDGGATVLRSLGHSSASITLNAYSHLWPDANDRTQKAAADLIELALGSTADALRTDSRN